jgi:hypothetical protein
MSPLGQVGGLTIARPLLSIWPEQLRQWLTDRGHSWREDASNRLPITRRNRMRQRLMANRPLAESLANLAAVCGELREQVRREIGELPQELPLGHWDRLSPLARSQAARLWLGRSGVPPGDISTGAVDRLLGMLDDRAAPAKLDFPGPVRVVRVKNRLKSTRVKKLPS